MTEISDAESKENARAYRSTPTTEMVTDNTLTAITKWKYTWKNSKGTNSTCDFTELKEYATDEHIRLLISKFQQSGWREGSKVSHFATVRRILHHAFNAQCSKRKAQNQSSILSRNMHSAYPCSLLINGKYRQGVAW
ncbi:hypothetical protein AB6C96_13975 [Vibrio cyclitrophicus]